MNRERYIVFRPERSALAAIPVRYVRETMRPLPLEPIAGAPSFVLGAAVVRGAPVPVLDAARLVTGRADAAVTRWVALEVGGRTAVLAVHEVLGVQPLAGAGEPAPLLSAAASGTIEELAARDGELLAVLSAGRLIELAGARP